MELTTSTLLTVAGIAVLTAVLLQLLVKPALKQAKDAPWYALALNVSATLIAIALATVGQYIAETEMSGPAIAFGIIQGFMSAFMAVFGYEGFKNITAAIRPVEGAEE